MAGGPEGSRGVKSEQKRWAQLSFKGDCRRNGQARPKGVVGGGNKLVAESRVKRGKVPALGKWEHRVRFLRWRVVLFRSEGGKSPNGKSSWREPEKQAKNTTPGKGTIKKRATQTDPLTGKENIIDEKERTLQKLLGSRSPVKKTNTHTKSHLKRAGVIFGLGKKDFEQKQTSGGKKTNH